jgi:NAD(P)H-flavin reductase
METMRNPYLPKTAIIKKIQPQTSEVKLFTFKFRNKKDQMEFLPGQFVEIGLPGFGEAPFALCSSMQILRGSTRQTKRRSDFQICVRKVGQLTEKLHDLRVGDSVTVRGPYGNGWPVTKIQNLLLIAGGTGLIPLRPLILQAASYKPGVISLFYGAKSYNELLFKNEYKIWQKNIDLYITLDNPHPKWEGDVGLITNLIEKQSSVISHQSSVFLCGPPVMYKFVLEKLKKLKIPDENIYLSLERRMHCGIGVCQHCAIGSKYVCKDGPVFNWAEIKDIPEII